MKRKLLLFCAAALISIASFGQADYADQQFVLGKELTNENELAEASFVVIQGHAPSFYDGFSDDSWIGDRFIATPERSEKEATASSLVKLIPAEEENTYYIYWVNHGKYFGTDNFNGTTGWQYSTGDLMYAKPVKFVYVGGRFIMSQIGLYNNEHVELHIATEPDGDTHSNLKIFSQDAKNGIEAGVYDNSTGTSYAMDFGFTVYEAQVNEEVVNALFATSITTALENLAYSIGNSRYYLETYKSLVIYEEDYTDYEASIVKAEQLLSAESPKFEDVISAVKDLENADIKYVIGVQYTYYDEYITKMLEDDNMFSETPEAGKYPESAKEYLYTAQMYLEPISGVLDGAPYSFEMYDAYMYIYMVSLSISQFEATYVQDYAKLPLVFTKEEHKLPGSTVMAVQVGSSSDGVKYLWNGPKEYVFDPAAPLDGMRITFTENNGGTAKSGNGYPGIAIDEFYIIDDAGNNVVPASIKTNAEQGGLAALAFDGDVDSYYSTGNGGNAHLPEGYAYIDLAFAEPLTSFKLKIVSNNEELSPAAFAITGFGETYDPRLSAANPYNVTVGNKVTSLADLTDGMYVIKGLLNTHPVYGKNEDGVQMGEGSFYTGTKRFHSNPKAVRDDQVFYVTTNADGTRSIKSIATAEYWGTFSGSGSQKGAKSINGAAKLTVVEAKSEALPGTFVLYEMHEGLTSEKEINDGTDVSYETVSTPYVVYMDWSTGLAARPVVGPQPGEGTEELLEYIDSYGDAYHFNKMNGEGQWEFYKVTMDNADYRYLVSLVAMAESIGYAEGNEPGLYPSLGNFPTALAAAKACVESEAHSNAKECITNLENAIAEIEKMTPNKLEVGKEYMLINGNDAYYELQGTTKAMYVDDVETYLVSWKNTPTERDNYFVFTFEQVSQEEDGIELSEKDRENAYWIKNVGTNSYIESITESSPGLTYGQYAGTYVVKSVGAGKFNIWHAASGEWYGLHTEGHASGAGAAGRIVYWDGNNAPSSWWRITSVEGVLGIEDLVSENAEVASVAYYTASGASIPAPAKGINIVVVTYTNGAVETKKVLVK